MKRIALTTTGLAILISAGCATKSDTVSWHKKEVSTVKVYTADPETQIRVPLKVSTIVGPQEPINLATNPPEDVPTMPTVATAPVRTVDERSVATSSGREVTPVTDTTIKTETKTVTRNTHRRRVHHKSAQVRPISSAVRSAGTVTLVDTERQLKVVLRDPAGQGRVTCRDGEKVTILPLHEGASVSTSSGLSGDGLPGSVPRDRDPVKGTTQTR